jgi:uncharacterized protein YlxP (DUF503 family)
MVVGLATLTLLIDDAQTLKDRRRVAKSVVARVRARFNVAVAEVEPLDRADTVALAVACVSTDAAHAHAMLEKVIDFIEGERLDANLAQVGIEIL